MVLMDGDESEGSETKCVEMMSKDVHEDYMGGRGGGQRLA